MARLHGSQCGFCTPGIVMSLFAHYQSCGGHTSRDTINDVLAGNLCRCTGYRPIVDSALEVCKTGADDQFTRKAAARLQALRALDDKADVFVGDEDVVLRRAGQRAVLRAALCATSGRHASSPAPPMSGCGSPRSSRRCQKIIHARPRGRAWRRSKTSAAGFEFGAIVSLTRAAPALGSIDPRRGRSAAPLRLHAGARGRHGRRQYRQRLADRRSRADADCARCHARAAPRRSSAQDAAGKFLSRLRQTGSPAGRICAPPAGAEACVGLALPRLQDHQAFRRGYFRGAAALLFESRRRHGSRDARVAFGGMAGIPKRAKAVEEKLRGLSLANASGWQAAADAVARISRRSPICAPAPAIAAASPATSSSRRWPKSRA